MQDVDSQKKKKLEALKRWIEKNREKHNAKRREWAAKNKDRVREYKQSEDAKKRNRDFCRKRLQDPEWRANKNAEARAKAAEKRAAMPPKPPRIKKQKPIRMCRACGLFACNKTGWFCVSVECVTIRDKKRRAKARACTIRYKKNNPEVVKSQKRKRRAIKKQVEHVKYFDKDIFKRDDWACYICSKKVDQSARFPHPDSPSIDHVIPLCKGGPDTPLNVKCSHLHCNISKGDKVLTRRL